MNELAEWLTTLPAEHRAVAEHVIRVYADMLVVLEGRQARLEEEHKHLLAGLADHERRITALEQLIDDILSDDELSIIVDLDEPKITSAA